MRIAVIGLGLIGGSIGLAARSRVGASVVGYARRAEVGERALELGAVDEVAASVAEAAADADVVFCAASVAALPALVVEALAASGPGAVVTDVGSTKAALIETVAAAADPADVERFIGGHPVAGAETAGVENAREDLFAGARWYLTPTRASSGVLYDRLQRLISELGARPQAIDAIDHDRLLATISHLPHVLANELVLQACGLGEDDEGTTRLPEVGPSFRDATRVAGANPAMWADIFNANRDAIATELEAMVARLGEAAALIRDGDPDAVEAWQARALGARHQLLETGASGEARARLDVAVLNRPGTVAEIALALGRAGVNIEDMTLYPASDMSSGKITLWVDGSDQAERAAAVIGELGHQVSLAEPGDGGASEA